jgi:hypothetical protein
MSRAPMPGRSGAGLSHRSQRRPRVGRHVVPPASVVPLPMGLVEGQVAWPTHSSTAHSIKPLLSRMAGQPASVSARSAASEPSQRRATAGRSSCGGARQCDGLVRVSSPGSRRLPPSRVLSPLVVQAHDVGRHLAKHAQLLTQGTPLGHEVGDRLVGCRGERRGQTMNRSLEGGLGGGDANGGANDGGFALIFGVVVVRRST